MADLQSFQQRARNNVWLALAEFALVAGLFYADVNHHIYVSKTLYLFVLGGHPCACGGCGGKTLASRGRQVGGKRCGSGLL